ncbi:MAG: DUF2179 domain-containing protein [Anaerolineae bacterium]
MLAVDVATAAFVIFLLRVIGVTLATIRVLLMTRGYKLRSATIGFFEVLVYVLAIGQVVQNLSNLWNVFGYCIGFFVGTLLGMWIEGRLALGHATVRVVSVERADAIADVIREAGYGATEGWGHGAKGLIGTVKTVVRRKDVDEVCALVRRTDPEAFITVEETRWVSRGYVRTARHER